LAIIYDPNQIIYAGGMNFRSTANLRYISFQIEAMATAATALSEYLPAELKVKQFRDEAEYAWHRQWKPISDRKPPHGGWDWASLRLDYRNDPTTLAVAIWLENALLGLLLGRLNNTAARIDYLEGTPDLNQPLRGKVILLAIEVGARYAQKAGRAELWLTEPVPAVREYAKRVFGFEYVEQQGKTPFCRRKV
jgi:hypothetical protein